MRTALPTYAIAHGGGPWPWMDPHPWTTLQAALEAIPGELGTTPKAVLMVTAHWEEPAFTVSVGRELGMLYDYWGFPPHTYEVTYPAPGHPEVAARVVELLTGAGIPSATDSERGYDHGTFVPAHVMYPAADVPIVQASINRNFSPEEHLAAGRALAPLREEGVLIVGSGLPSYHNLGSAGAESAEPSRLFDDWLTESMVGHDGTARTDRLVRWEEAPAARIAHPREEHLLPLLVAVGAAEHEAAVRNYHEEDGFFGHTASSGYRIGALN